MISVSIPHRHTFTSKIESLSGDRRNAFRLQLVPYSSGAETRHKRGSARRLNKRIINISKVACRIDTHLLATVAVLEHIRTHPSTYQVVKIRTHTHTHTHTLARSAHCRPLGTPSQVLAYRIDTQEQTAIVKIVLSTHCRALGTPRQVFAYRIDTHLQNATMKA